MAITYIKPDKIVSVGDFAAKIGKLSGRGRLLFRGQNVDRPLLPKICRQLEVVPAEFEQIERRMLDRFRKESAPFLNGVSPRNDWDWLSIAQHQGLPTRLLDWSANAMAALWFAVATDPPPGEINGVVWCLRVHDDDLKSPSDDANIFQLKRTHVFQPFHIDKRIAAQAGWFSVHKYSERAGKFVSLDANKDYKDRLTKYSIDGKLFSKVRGLLRTLGVTRASLFPDLSGLCADIQEEQLGSRREIEKI